MNPLAALGMDRASLMRESIRVQGGMVYPGIRTLSTEKAREGASMPLGYDLLYKPDVSLDGRKTGNGYMGLYKNGPPGLQKPMGVPGPGESLGLDPRGQVDKPIELGLAGSNGFLRLPWVSPYPDEIGRAHV